MANAQKEQRYREYGEMRSLSIETDTFVQDVPMTDCFFVTDRVLVEATGANGTAFTIFWPNLIFVSSRVQYFEKESILKWFQGLGEYWSESIVLPMETKQEEKHLVACCRIGRNCACGG
jgi:hypothetical protein